MVTAYAGGIERKGESDEAGGGRTFGDEVAGENEVVCGGGEGEF